mmetsp:Transcript_130067/g.243288  ORF Transcript_130067/g.243288 Transcript_130067/m.243288 type:complete len:309 (+) Transcript_130067:62-988(+)
MVSWLARHRLSIFLAFAKRVDLDLDCGNAQSVADAFPIFAAQASAHAITVFNVCATSAFAFPLDMFHSIWSKTRKTEIWPALQVVLTFLLHADTLDNPTCGSFVSALCCFFARAIREVHLARITIFLSFAGLHSDFRLIFALAKTMQPPALLACLWRGGTVHTDLVSNFPPWIFFALLTIALAHLKRAFALWQLLLWCQLPDLVLRIFELSHHFCKHVVGVLQFILQRLHPLSQVLLPLLIILRDWLWARIHCDTARTGCDTASTDREKPDEELCARPHPQSRESRRKCDRFPVEDLKLQAHECPAQT